MEDSTLRNRLSILWLSGSVISITTIALELLSGAKQGVTMGTETLFVLSVIGLSGPFMAFLSQILGARANRWANIFTGITVEIIAVLVLVLEVTTVPAIALDPALGLLFPALVVWYAWKSKQGSGHPPFNSFRTIQAT